MKLTNEFIQLPLLFDVEQLKKEVAKFTQADWKPHHEGFNGNFSIPLISVGGKNNNDFKGEMKETSYLQSSPYLRQVISSFGEVIGRSRLMGLAPGAEVPLHSDINYHWFRRVRIHVPIVTEPSVTFYCADKEINMKAGEAWIFDSWKYHRVSIFVDLVAFGRYLKRAIAPAKKRKHHALRLLIFLLKRQLNRQFIPRSIMRPW